MSRSSNRRLHQAKQSRLSWTR